MDQMGSPFLLAHGIGKPVQDASTEVMIPKKGLGMYMLVPGIGVLPGR